MKGIIFAGCSFTWGQGLYYYSNLPNVIKLSDSEFNQKFITDAQIKFKNTLYYPRLVANHFNTFEVVKSNNGGSEYDSFEFIEDSFNGKSPICCLNYDDIEYIIFQTSQITRNKFKFNYKGTDYNLNIPFKNQFSNNKEDRIFIEWLYENNSSFDEWYDIFKNQILHELNEFLKFYEEKGIKTKILCWQDDLLKLIFNNEEISKKLIILDYNNKTYNCIDDLIKLNNGMLISNDSDLTNPPQDHHPSKNCHRIIADSIIKNIEKDIL
jgi:hypothetical protein